MNSCTTWTDAVGQKLIYYAARCAPESLSERLKEEWLADFAARSPSGSRLRFAIGCCWATRVIAHEHRPSSIRVTGTAVAGKFALANDYHNLSWFSRRSSTLFLVVTLHVALFYVLVTKLSHTQTKLPAPPFVVETMKEELHRDLPVLPPPAIGDPVITLKPPVIDVPVDPSPPVDRSAVETEQGGAPPRDVPTPPPVRPAHVVVRAAGGPGAGFPSAEDFYPDSAKRLGEQGIAIVQVCVDATGRLTAEPATLHGSGSARLDNGALKLAKAGSGHYRASTEDGLPVDSCYPFRIRFQLRN